MEDEWIEWRGESAAGPLDSETVVVVRVRDGFVHEPFTVGWWAGDHQPNSSNWHHHNDRSDIIAYRVVSP